MKLPLGRIQTSIFTLILEPVNDGQLCPGIGVRKPDLGGFGPQREVEGLS